VDNWNERKADLGMAVVTMRQLLESGVHFGHQTRRWNPKMKRFIMTERNGIYIIDLQQSLTYINDAYEFIKETVAHGGTILFVGTKKQAQEPIAEQATRVGMPYVTYRWLGGMLTNFQTVSKRLSRLKELEEVDFADVAGSGRTKKELLVMKREKVKLEKTLGGIRDMAKIPSAVWIVDTKKEHLAVTEARKLKLPVIAILDTNCDPDEVDYKIPGNDDAIRSVTLLTRVVADAVAEGLMARAAARGGGEAVDFRRRQERGGAAAEMQLGDAAGGVEERRGERQFPLQPADVFPGGGEPLGDDGRATAIPAQRLAERQVEIEGEGRIRVAVVPGDIGQQRGAVDGFGELRRGRIGRVARAGNVVFPDKLERGFDGDLDGVAW